MTFKELSEIIPDQLANLTFYKIQQMGYDTWEWVPYDNYKSYEHNQPRNIPGYDDLSLHGRAYADQSRAPANTFRFSNSKNSYENMSNVDLDNEDNVIYYDGQREPTRPPRDDYIILDRRGPYVNNNVISDLPLP